MTTWKMDVAERVEEELELFLIKVLVRRMTLTGYRVRTVGLRLEVGRGRDSRLG